MRCTKSLIYVRLSGQCHEPFVQKGPRRRSEAQVNLADTTIGTSVRRSGRWSGSNLADSEYPRTVQCTCGRLWSPATDQTSICINPYRKPIMLFKQEVVSYGPCCLGTDKRIRAGNWPPARREHACIEQI
jgi:hypothetical protein